MSISIAEFQQIIWDFYQINRRSFLWRDIICPYYVFVSEVMLQQTQTYRVAPKFERWIQEFPDFDVLAKAPLHTVLSAWQGLGYNRRALALQKNAMRVMEEFQGQLPDDPAILQTFAGIGKATAASICAFAFNKPTIFIETNIRTVFIHFFFSGQDQISDAQLVPLVQASVDVNHPRDWYYALMDYGVMLKKQQGNLSKKSVHYTTQSRFEGSFRQIRGQILKVVTQQIVVSYEDLYGQIVREKLLIDKAIEQLKQEGFIKEDHGKFFIA